MTSIAKVRMNAILRTIVRDAPCIPGYDLRQVDRLKLMLEKGAPSVVHVDFSCAAGRVTLGASAWVEDEPVELSVNWSSGGVRSAAEGGVLGDVQDGVRTFGRLLRNVEALVTTLEIASADAANREERKTKAAACSVCGGWTDWGSCSSLSRSAEGCVCEGKGPAAHDARRARARALSSGN